MKIYEFLAILAFVLGFFSTSSALGDEPLGTKKFRFEAETSGAISHATSQANGEYEVAVSNGKCEVSIKVNEQFFITGGYAAEELCRMVGFDPDGRRYLELPLHVGKTWSQSHSYNIPGARKTFRRTINYKVVGEETITTTAGAFRSFKVEGNAKTSADQIWTYYYAEEIGLIVKFFYDSAIGEEGAKVSIKLIKDN